MSACDCTSSSITPVCSPVPTLCCQPEVTVQTYTFENANASGVGVFDNETSFLVQFRGIVSASDGLTVTLDDPNNTIILTLDMSELVDDIPDATTTQRGVLETATDGEAQAKVATDKILTPSNLAALGATQTFVGLIEISTNAEALAGASATLAITPASLAAVVATIQPTTFADAVARNAATPDFEGQFGAQLDVGSAWLSIGVAAGDWRQILTGNTQNDLSSVLTTIEFQNGTFTFDGATTGAFNFEDVSLVLFTASPVTFSAGSTVTFSNSNLVFQASSQIHDASGVIPVDSVLITDPSNAGLLSNAPIAQFLSEFNVQTGWGTPSGTLARTTFASYAGQTVSNPPTQGEVQAIDDALRDNSRRLAALITDLLAFKVPAA